MNKLTVLDKDTTKVSITKSSKTIAATVITSLMLLNSNLALADNNANQQTNSNSPDPCGAELCLSGIGLAGGINACKPHIKKFFSISATGKYGVFLPGVTYVKRYKWLNQCKSGNAAFKLMIMNAYGQLPSSPF